ncbi:uncharacterized protein PSFLO_00510 [Pseudozyma flocculosa]|uniref:Uncharacterized protein n=1 Tax=Pseudozyma flocculosa TaxID=84751 RepID=A0A5C3EV82_9BASI|nr:uncharacterized protein PSFLO_00510 [Pseudozyma flocculosa]
MSEQTGKPDGSGPSRFIGALGICRAGEPAVAGHEAELLGTYCRSPTLAPPARVANPNSERTEAPGLAAFAGPRSRADSVWPARAGLSPAVEDGGGDSRPNFLGRAQTLMRNAGASERGHRQAKRAPLPTRQAAQQHGIWQMSRAKTSSALRPALAPA